LLSRLHLSGAAQIFAWGFSWIQHKTPYPSYCTAHKCNYILPQAI
jgi:hypothetical protein